MELDKSKYRLLRPSIANTFDVITIKGSDIMAKTAGIESRAKIRSVISTITRATNNGVAYRIRSEEHTSELQSRQYLVCRLLLEKKKQLHHVSLPVLTKL